MPFAAFFKTLLTLINATHMTITQLSGVKRSIGNDSDLNALDSSHLQLEVKRSRTATPSHESHEAEFACTASIPLRTFLFDHGAGGPAEQQASLERHGWVAPGGGQGRERVALLCPFADCRAVVMEFVAASKSLHPLYKNRMCGHQFSMNRACESKWAQHRGMGATARGKVRRSHCTSSSHSLTPTTVTEISPPPTATNNDLEPMVTVEPASPTQSQMESQPLDLEFILAHFTPSLQANLATNQLCDAVQKLLPFSMCYFERKYAVPELKDIAMSEQEIRRTTIVSDQHCSWVSTYHIDSCHKNRAEYNDYRICGGQVQRLQLSGEYYERFGRRTYPNHPIWYSVNAKEKHPRECYEKDEARLKVIVWALNHILFPKLYPLRPTLTKKGQEKWWAEHSLSCTVSPESDPLNSDSAPTAN